MADATKALKIIDLGENVLQLVVEFLSAEKARTGLSYEEIFDQATAHIDANEAALKADLEEK